MLFFVAASWPLAKLEVETVCVCVCVCVCVKLEDHRGCWYVTGAKVPGCSGVQVDQMGQ